MKLKTLKNIDFSKLEFRERRTSEYLIENLKQEAIKWVKEIDNDIHMYYKRLRNHTKKNTDVTNAQRWHLRKWIINFFNITEEDLK